MPAAKWLAARTSWRQKYEAPHWKRNIYARRGAYPARAGRLDASALQRLRSLTGVSVDSVRLVAVMLGIVLAGAVSTAANGRRPQIPRTLSPSQHVDRFDITQDARRQPEPTLSINDVRIEKAHSDAPTPSLLLLKFDLLNEGESPVADLLIEVAIVEKSSEPEDQTLTRAVAGPFTVQGHVIVEPGDALQFEMRFRNVSPECACAATVRVVSARALTDLQH